MILQVGYVTNDVVSRISVHSTLYYLLFSVVIVYGNYMVCLFRTKSVMKIVISGEEFRNARERKRLVKKKHYQTE